MQGNKKNKAVSPVVAVILMVAITVILAAVIGTFVLDLGGNVEENAQAGVTFEKLGNGDVRATVVSVQNAESLKFLANGSTKTKNPVEAGNTVTISSSDVSDGDQITVVATHPGGEKTTVQTYTVGED